MKIISIILLSIFLLLITQESLAWGGRGHDTICQAATFLVQNHELKSFLQHRPHVMGHLCNIPDITWRSISGDLNKRGAATHYIDADILPMSVKDIPLDLKKLIQDFTGKKRANRPDEIKSIPLDLGTVWWRVNQFMELARKSKELFAKSTPTDDNKNDLSPFNQAAYDFMVHIGVMGHFVGDNAQPFHSTDDYDGYAKGHGGIHSYYEEFVVAHLDSDLLSRVVKEAKRLLDSPRKETYLVASTPLEKMRELTVYSFNDIEKVLKADLLIKTSENKEEKGMKIRTPAERVPLTKTIKKFEPLIIKHMGRASALLAQLWDEAYLQAGSPQLSKYRSYRYPLNPEFVAPDYD